jgi:hypothetical protein
MKVLLISANRLTEPFPVYPLGLDYVAGAIAPDHEVCILDMNQLADGAALEAAIRTWLDAFPPETPALAEAIEAALEQGRLPCRAAWALAERFKLRKMAVSGACEALGIKIKPCQLGAF